jgi:hypothetical protein
MHHIITGTRTPQTSDVARSSHGVWGLRQPARAWRVQVRQATQTDAQPKLMGA